MPKEIEKLQRSPRDVARWQKAQQDLLKGRSDRALAGYRELLKAFPDTAELWFESGLAAAKQLDFELADQAFQRAAGLAPGDVALLVLLGQQYHQLRWLDKARACFERAVAAAPSSIHARLSLADWYERERRLDDAWECVEACAAGHPQDAQVLCVKALLLHRLGRNAEAERLLRDLIQGGSPDLNVKYSSRHQLAVVLDELGQYAEAMRWLGEAKAVLRQTANIARLEQDYDRAARRHRELLAALTPQTIQRWRREGSPAASRYRLAFLGGHPRSGTTLLEQILGAHPGIAAFDEPMAFVQEVSEQLAPFGAASGPSLNALDALSAAQRAHFQQRYFKSLLREGAGEPAVELLLDKNPSPTGLLHLWLRVFPDLKVIIALRDPRDVIISCFFQNLMLSATNANFLSLERTARHYADLMDVWLRLRELGGFDWMETRYEDIVNNLEAEGRRVTEFLGLTWHPQQANYHETARKKFVFAPTYREVTQPVYRRAVGRWQRYAEALAPVQERLAPYCRAFGYPTDLP
ncbi:MAG: sulfotransferase [Verrucomicrobiia bacterium]